MHSAIAATSGGACPTSCKRRDTNITLHVYSTPTLWRIRVHLSALSKRSRGELLIILTTVALITSDTGSGVHHASLGIVWSIQIC